jgi:hypothetical protein
VKVFIAATARDRLRKRLNFGGIVEFEATVAVADLDLAAVFESAEQELFTKRLFQLVLKQAIEWSSTELGTVSFASEVLSSSISKL